MGSGTGVALALAGAMALAVLTILRITTTTVVAISVILAISSSTYLDRSVSTGLSEVVRVASVLVIVRLLWGPAPQQGRADERAARRCGQLVRVLIAAIMAYVALATVEHEMYRTLLFYGAGAALTVLYGETIARRIAGPHIRKGVLIALIVTIAGSVVFGLFRAGDGILGERLRGLVSNPNLLGYYVILVVALLMSYRRFALWMLPVGFVTGAALLWSGSRAALLASALVVIMNLAIRRSPWRILWILLGAAILVLTVSHPNVIADNDLTILRSNNSRMGSYEYTMMVLSETGWQGVGLGAELVQVASTPLRALTHAGLAGGAVVLMMYGVILYYSAKFGPRTLVFGGAMIVHSVFEGWLLTPIGPMTICFLATWCALAKCSAPTPVLSSREPVHAVA